MLDVMITIDTEVYPLQRDWRADNLQRDIRRDVYGETSSGAFGLRYQVELLRRAKVKGVFFVEGLFASATGLDPLKEIVGTILAAGHEVQLHLHPEWLEWMPNPPVRADGRQLLRQFSVDEQVRLVAAARRNLEEAGAPSILAFRAGDFAANDDTLEALRRSGIRYDTSCSPGYPGSFPETAVLRRATQPVLVSGVCEVPVSYWITRGLGRRHAQLTASSSGELRGALRHASQEDWATFVIVSHSFELLKRRRHFVHDPRPDRIVVERLAALCRHLEANQGDLRTAGFRDLDPVGVAASGHKEPFVSPAWLTADRLAQQAFRRLF